MCLTKVVSVTNSLLLRSQVSIPPPYVAQWECRLGRTLPTTDLDGAFTLTYKLSISCRIPENSYKILTRWSVFPSHPEICCRTGSMEHTWWTAQK